MSSREEELLAKVQADPYDGEAWQEVLRVAKTSGSQETLIERYESFLTTFPSSGLYWKRFAQACFDAGDHAKMNEVLSRALRTNNTDIDLWVFYVTTVRANVLAPAEEALAAVPTDNLAQLEVARNAVTAARESVGKAFNFALDRIGSAISADAVWRLYFEFLKQPPVMEGLFHEGRRRDGLRRAYQRVVGLAIHGVEAWWTEYTEFEKAEAQSTLAQALIQQNQSNFKSAQHAYNLKKDAWAALQLNRLARPPGHVPASASAAVADAVKRRDDEQVAAWKRVLEIEKRNDQRLPDEKFVEHMRLVYQQCVNSLRLHPEFWLDWAGFEQMAGDTAATTGVYTQALEVLRDSELLVFAAADYFESQGDTEKAVGAYEVLLEARPTPLAFILYQRFSRRQPDGLKAARKVFSRARKVGEACTPEVFLASASMELHQNKQPDVARKVLEFGRKRYPSDPGFAAACVDLLVPTMDDNNARVYFESIVTSLSGKPSLPIWDRYLEFEASRSDPARLTELEERRREAAGDSSFFASLQGMLHRYHVYGLSPSSGSDADFLRRNPFAGAARNLPLGAVARLEAVEGARGPGAGAGAGAGAGSGAAAGAGVGSGAAAAAGHMGRPGEPDPDAPEFLHRLLGLLPKVYIGPRNRPDFVIRRMRQIQMPPMPPRSGGGRGGLASGGGAGGGGGRGAGGGGGYGGGGAGGGAGGGGRPGSLKRGRDDAPPGAPPRSTPRVDVFGLRQQHQL